MTRTGTAWIHLAGYIALIGTIIHFAAIVGGVPWYIFFKAPPSVVASAREGTWLAPVSTAAIAAAMGLCAAYAFSAAGVIRRLPLLRLMLGGMATVCLVRAFILLPLLATRPDLRNMFQYVADVVWALAGVGFAVGCRLGRAEPTGRTPLAASVDQA